MRPHGPGITPEQGRTLHQRLLAGERTASYDLAEAVLDPLGNWLVRTYPQQDLADLWTIAEDVILKYAERPQAFDADRMDLWRYLLMSARGDIKNLIRSRQRRESRLVELTPSTGNSSWVTDDDADCEGTDRPRTSLDVAQTAENDDPAMIVASFEQSSGARVSAEVINAVRSTLSAGEAAVLELMLRQVRRDTPSVAKALGIAHLPEVEQRREAKRVLDRLTIRLKRAGLRAGLGRAGEARRQ